MEKGKGQESVSTSSTLNAQSFVGFARKANFAGANEMADGQQTQHSNWN